MMPWIAGSRDKECDGGSEKCPGVPGYSPKSEVLLCLRTLHLLANRVSRDRDIKVRSAAEQAGSSGD